MLYYVHDREGDPSMKHDKINKEHLQDVYSYQFHHVLFVNYNP